MSVHGSRLASSLARSLPRRAAACHEVSRCSSISTSSFSSALEEGRSSGSDGKSSRSLAVAGLLSASAFVASQSAGSTECQQSPEDRLGFWKDSWEKVPNGRSPIFHYKEPNRFLLKHMDRLIGDASACSDSAGPAVLVPLCGKSLDMLSLGQYGLSVVGVEGVDRAMVNLRDESRCLKNAPLYEAAAARPVCIKGFKKAQQLSLGAAGWSEGAGFQAAEEFDGSRPGTVFKHGPNGLGYYTDSPKLWRGRMITKDKGEQPIDILHSDFLDVTPQLVGDATFVKQGTFELAYDRGSFSALVPETRRAFADRMAALMRHGGRILMVAAEYDQSKVPYDPTGKKRSPPPFSVSLKDLKAAFRGSSWKVELIDSEPHDPLENWPPHFKDVEVTTRVYLITRTSGSMLGSIAPLGVLGILGAGAAYFYNSSR